MKRERLVLAAVWTLLLVALPGTGRAVDIDGDGVQDNSYPMVDLNNDGFDDSYLSASTEGIVDIDVLIVHDTNPLAYFGWYRANQMPPTGWDLFQRTIDWADGRSLPAATNVILFTFDGSLDPETSAELGGIAVYEYLTGAGYNVAEVHPQVDIETLVSSYYDSFDLAIYAWVFPRDATQIVNSGIPFVTFSAGETDELGIGSGETTMHMFRSQFYVHDNSQYPTQPYPVGPLTFESGLFTQATKVSGNGIVLVAGTPTSPIANAGADRLYCALAGEATVNLDGSGSSDLDSTPGTHDDIVLFEWFEDFALPSEQFLGSGEFLSTPLASGPHAITLRVTDTDGLTSTDDLLVTVQEDLGPPVLSLVLTPESLWPPNHRMVDVHADVTATDDCSEVTVVLDSITSSEPDDAPGGSDGHTSGDIVGAAVGTADFDFRLRAERDARGIGRQHLVTYRGTDDAGNEVTLQRMVAVAHNQGGVKEPLTLSVGQTPQGTLLSWGTVAGAMFYNVGRGDSLNLSDAGDHYDLGLLTCIASASAAADTIGSEDLDLPALGEAFFYLVEYDDGSLSGLGTVSAGKPRTSMNPAFCF